MPPRSRKPCRHPGCTRLQVTAYCDEHRPKPKAWTRNNASKRVHTGRRLQQERDRLFAEFPLCAECLKGGIEREATVRDHIIPLAEGGEDTRANTQGLCRSCHDDKTAEESRRGRGWVKSLGG